MPWLCARSMRTSHVLCTEPQGQCRTGVGILGATVPAPHKEFVGGTEESPSALEVEVGEHFPVWGSLLFYFVVLRGTLELLLFFSVPVDILVPHSCTHPGVSLPTFHLGCDKEKNNFHFSISHTLPGAQHRPGHWSCSREQAGKQAVGWGSTWILFAVVATASLGLQHWWQVRESHLWIWSALLISEHSCKKKVAGILLQLPDNLWNIYDFINFHNW